MDSQQIFSLVLCIAEYAIKYPFKRIAKDIKNNKKQFFSNYCEIK